MITETDSLSIPMIKDDQNSMFNCILFIDKRRNYFPTSHRFSYSELRKITDRMILFDCL